jgi:hypothetical protein
MDTAADEIQSTVEEVGSGHQDHARANGDQTQ